MEASPRRVAIEKAQAELRQECDVREKRRRELAFLEKGGNPLDFKFGHTTSISVESTSLAAQLVEQYAFSEGKVSFARSASTHCDSVESSGRPEVSMGREVNTADNLLLLNGSNGNDQYREKNAKNMAKRGIMLALEQSSAADNIQNAKELDDVPILSLGTKRQAYTRRNRSRSVRDCSNSRSSDPIKDTKYLVPPSSVPNSKDLKALPGNEGFPLSSISNSKPESPTSNGILKFPSDQYVVVRVQNAGGNMLKAGVVDCAAHASLKGSLVNHEHTKHANLSGEQIPNDDVSSSSDVGAKCKSVLDGPTMNLSGDLEASSTGERGGIVKEPNNVYFLNGVPGSNNYFTDSKTGTSNDGSASNPVFSFYKNNNDAADNFDPLPVKRVGRTPDGDYKELLVLESTDTIKVTPGIEENNPHDIVCPMVENKSENGLCTCPNGVKIDEKPVSGNADGCLNNEIILNSENASKIVTYTETNVPKDLTTMPSVDSFRHDLSNDVSSKSNSSTKNVAGTTNHINMRVKINEDAILNEARIIEATLKRAGELPMEIITPKKQSKCHWDFVLEEMAWMANDFMQERLWKISAAALVCRQAASATLSNFMPDKTCRNLRHIAQTLTQAVLNFWRLAESFQANDETLTIVNEAPSDLLKSQMINDSETSGDQGTRTERRKQAVLPIQLYAIRFLKYFIEDAASIVPIEGPATPDRVKDSGTMESSFDGQISEDNLFYTVPPGAMQSYRESVESLWLPCKDKYYSMHLEDHETSVCYSATDCRQENMFDEDEAETETYFLPVAYEDGFSSKLSHKKRKGLQQPSHVTSFYEFNPDFSYKAGIEKKIGNQSLIYTGKRPPSVLNVGIIPPKRVRTATRQRVASPFGGEVTRGLQMTSKTEASSGDTNSYQDDQSSLQGLSLPRKNVEIESTMDSMQYLPYNGHTLSTKSKKNKKTKNLGYKNSMNMMDPGALVIPGKGLSYDQKSQVDPIVLHEQSTRKRFDGHLFESNGNPGFYGPHVSKKPKLMKHLPETSQEINAPISGPIPSTVASQMSNMPNPNKLMRIIINRDKRKKSKEMKVPGGNSVSGIPWSSFEDQALVVLVHDLGPNWELISDSINSTVQFKYIFRKPRECKERHKFLMDKSAGDGADSAEDSGSSQPYPSTLPGIPKGSARQLFQRLQGPMLEDTLKLHFEKIISIGHQLHSHRSQVDCQEQKQIVSPHHSHAVTFSQTCSNNLSGAVLTPLDLVDATSSNSDMLGVGYQGGHANGITTSNHPMSVLVSPVHPTASGNGILQGSAGLNSSGVMPSPSSLLNMNSRDAHRFGVARSVLQADDHQRMPQYNQIMHGRGVQQSGVAVQGGLPSGIDRGGVRMLSGGNGMGVMCGIKRSMPMHRSVFQGMNSPGMLNMASSCATLPGNAVGVPNVASIQTSPAVSGTGSSMIAPRETLDMLRPAQSTEDQRQLIQELHMQAAQGNGQNVQAATAFNGTSSPFPNSPVPPVQTFPVINHHQQSHQMPQDPCVLNNPHQYHIQSSNHFSPRQQAYGIRFPKDRQLQERAMSQSQSPFSGTSAIPSSQNGSHQAQSLSPVVSLPSQSQLKQQQMIRTPQQGHGVPNQITKQRHRPQVQQQGRSNQQQQQASTQPAKLMKNMTSGTTLMHQNLSGDNASNGNGLPPASRNNQVSEKLIAKQNPGFSSGNPGVNQSFSQLPGQQKMYSRALPQPSKSTASLPSHSESDNQGSPQVTAPLLNPEQSPANQLQQQQANNSQHNMQRLMLQKTGQTLGDQVQGSQMVSTTSVPQCANSVSSSAPVSQVVQWKHEGSYDTKTLTSSIHYNGSPQERVSGNEAVLPSSGSGFVPRQFPGVVPRHGHLPPGGQWQQQQQYQQSHQAQPRHQQTTIGTGNLYPRPSNSGPG